MTDSGNQDEEQIRRLMMGALDGELTPAERTELERRLEHDPTLRTEWIDMQRVKSATGSLALRDPPDEVWATYWSSVYARLERGTAWVLVSLGAIIGGSWAVWIGLRDLLARADLPFIVKGGIVAGAVGLVALIVSVAREKWFVYRSDPYKDVTR